jgi:hypothetical protein
MPKFLNNIDLNSNQLLNPVIHVSSQATTTNGPNGDATGTEGQIFYNSHANGKALYFRDNSGWRPIGDISGIDISVGTGLDISQSNTTGGAYTSTISLDISEFSDVTPANGDKLLTLDSDGSTEQLTTVAALATLFAGSGLTATNSVIAVDTLNQDTTGTADHVTITDNENTDEENQITFIEGAAGAGSRGLEADGDFTYNPSTGTVSATVFKGNIDAVNGDFDGTLEADAITIGNTNIVSGSLISSLATVTQSEVNFTTDTFTVASTNANDPLVIIKNTTNDTNGAKLQFVKDKGAAAADGDDVGSILFTGDDAAQTQTDFGNILVQVGEADNTDEAGTMSLQVACSDGTNTGLRSGLVLTGHKTSNYVDATIGNGANSTVTASGNLTVTGNLTVSGDTITANVGTLDVEDKNITLNKSAGDSSSTADGAGITIQDAVNSSTDATILWDATNDEFDFSHAINVTGTIEASGTITGTLSGTASVATTVTVADESSDTTCFPLFATAATGNLGPKSGSNLTFNSSSGLLTATSFAGDLTGDVTGNADTATNLTASTSTAVKLGTIELGHGSDTTIARSAAGKATIEGNLIGVVETFNLDHSDSHVSANNASSDSTEFTIEHGMGNSRFYKVEVIQDSGNYDTVYTDVTRPSDTEIKITFGSAVANGAYRAMVTRMA